MPSPKPKFKVEWEFITPEIAAGYIATLHPKQRKINPRTVERYRQDMVAGTFAVNPLPIIFDESELVIEGQHRLSALAKSGIEGIWMTVSRKWPEKLIMFLGNEQPRTIAQQAKIHGTLADKPESWWATVRSALLGVTHNPGGKPPHSVLFNFAEKYIEQVDFVYDNTQGILGMCAPVRGVLVRAAAQPLAEVSRIRDMCTVMKTFTPVEANGQSDTAAQALSRFIKATPNGGYAQRAEILHKTQNAVDAFLHRRPMQQLKAVERNIFPLPEDFTAVVA